MEIKIKKIHKEARIPDYATKNDAGMDLYAVDDKVVVSGEIWACPTGIAMMIPSGYVGLIWDKSGIALNGGVKTMGGVIDSGYRGEIRVIMKNLSDENYVINKGDKIAQILIQKVESFTVELVDELDESERGGGGFGSTGLK